MAINPAAFLIAAAVVFGGFALCCGGGIWICLKDRRTRRERGIVW